MLPTNKLALLFSIATALASTTTAFSTTPSSAVTPPQVDLDTLGPKLCGNTLEYKITFGTKEQPFPIQNVQVQLSSDLKTRKRSSTGIHDANLLSNPTYVNEKGLQNLELVKGGWELQWNVRQKSPHGFLTCSFVSPTQVTRNPKKEVQSSNNNKEDAENKCKIPEGRFLIMHRVWTRATLESERDRRRQIQKEAAQQLQNRDEKVREITSDEKSAVSKVKAYAEAAKSMNDYRASGYQEALYIPLYDKQVLELVEQECIMSTRGQIFQSGNQRGLLYLGESRVDLITSEDAK